MGKKRQTQPRRKRGPEPDPQSKRSQGMDRHVAPRVVFHLPPALLEVIEQQRKPARRTRTAEILQALEGHYASLGLWPPSDQPDQTAKT